MKTYLITCTRNWSKPPKYNTHFKWENSEIALDYHYDDDDLKIFIDGDNWIEGDNENIDTLIGLLSNGMVNLEYEDCKEGEGLEIKNEQF
jgi:hypothetical protein